MNVSESLLKAADVLQYKGWTRREYQNKKGQVCLSGAIRLATTGEADLDNLDSYEAHIFLKDFILDTRVLKNIKWASAIPAYNDKVAKSKREVIGLLKRAARLAVKQGK